MKEKQTTAGVLLVGIIVSMFLWGLSWPSGKVLTQYISPVDLVIYRYLVVVVTLLPILFFLRVGVRVKKEGIPGILASGLLLALYSYFFFQGLKNGAAGAGGVLVTTLNPIIAYLIGLSLQRKKPTKNESTGLVLGFLAGCVLLRVWSNPGAIFSGGNTYFLLASVLWAVMSKFTSKATLYGSSLSFSLWQYLTTLLCLLPLLDVKELETVARIRDSVFWINLFFSSAIVTTLATTVYFYATTRLGPEKASSFIFMVPLSAAISAWLFLGESILMHTVIGGILGILAVYTINRK